MSPACRFVGNDTGGSHPAAEMVNDHRVQHMRNIVVRRVGKSVVDAFPGLITVYLYDRARKGIGQPTFQFPAAAPEQEFYPISILLARAKQLFPQADCL